MSVICLVGVCVSRRCVSHSRQIMTRLSFRNRSQPTTPTQATGENWILQDNEARPLQRPPQSRLAVVAVVVAAVAAAAVAAVAAVVVAVVVVAEGQSRMSSGKPSG